MVFAKQKMSCKEIALQLLSRRDHGEWELQSKLNSRGFSPEDVETALTYCRHYGYIDDVRYARGQIRQHLYKGHGEQRIRQELGQNRVNNDVINLVLEEQSPDWFELAKQTALKKFKGEKSDDPKWYARQVRFLQYRGFSFEQIKYALGTDE